MCSAIVLALQPKESPQQNFEHIASIYRNLDSLAAEQVVARALGELGQMLVSLADRIAGHHLQDALRRIKRLERMAENLGLVTFSGVARDLAQCLERGDSTAFAAVWARLLRVADCTLSYDPEKQDLGGA